MTENGGNKGFSGLDGLVSDVDKGLQDASPGSQKQGPGQTRPAPPRPRAQPRPVATKPSRPSTPPPPVNSGSGGKNVWLWILGGFVVFLVWAANQDGSSGRTTSSSSTNYSPPSTSRPQATPSLPTLSTPPVGTNHVHSTAEIRYCIASDIRVEALRPYMNSDSQIDAFNGIVSDYNSRCGSYRYRSGALERARREIEPYRAAIVANAWDGVSLSARTAPQQKPAVQRSQLTTDIQKALSVLGYDPGVADGLYGRKTKNAIEAFQRDYGLTVNGVESQELLRHLRRVVELKRNYQSSSDQSTDQDHGGELAANSSQDTALRDALTGAASKRESPAGRVEADIWLSDMSRRLERDVPDPEERIEILTLVHQEAVRVELPPELILAVIEVESKFDRYAVSVSGEVGLMQVAPYWLEEIGRPGDNLLNIGTNLRYGCTILRYYYDMENGDLRRALGRYDGSLGKRKYPNARLKSPFSMS